MFAYDEVKTGFTVAWGGAIEAFGVQPDLVAFAKAIGARSAVRRRSAAPRRRWPA